MKKRKQLLFDEKRREPPLPPPLNCIQVIIGGQQVVGSESLQGGKKQDLGEAEWEGGRALGSFVFL